MRSWMTVTAAAAAILVAAGTARADDRCDDARGRSGTGAIVRIHTRTEPVTTTVIRYETRVERVVVREGYWQEVVVRPAEYGWRRDVCARRWVRVLLRPEVRERRYVPPVVEERVVRVPVEVRVPAPCPEPPRDRSTSLLSIFLRL
jgi:hypothetical protein